MRVNIRTCYAIHIIIELAKNRKMSSKNIAERLDVREHYLARIITKLCKANIIHAIQGANGGFVLHADVEKLTLLDILNVMETTVKINRCLEDDCFCFRNTITECEIRKKYIQAQEMLEEKLSRETFQKYLDYEERGK